MQVIIHMDAGLTFTPSLHSGSCLLRLACEVCACEPAVRSPVPRRCRVAPLEIWRPPNVNQVTWIGPARRARSQRGLGAPLGALWASGARFMGSYAASGAPTRFSQNAKYGGGIFRPPFSRAQKVDFGFLVDPCTTHGPPRVKLDRRMR